MDRVAGWRGGTPVVQHKAQPLPRDHALEVVKVGAPIRILPQLAPDNANFGKKGEASQESDNYASAARLTMTARSQSGALASFYLSINHLSK